MTSLSSSIYPVVWDDCKVRLIDQTRLPNQYNFVEVGTVEEMAFAIKSMIVRGAPAIGVAAAYGMVLGAMAYKGDSKAELLEKLELVGATLKQTRPTAVNLFWAIDKMLKTAGENTGDLSALRSQLLSAAKNIQEDDLNTCKAIGQHGLSVLPDVPEKLTILTHCNTGSLATAGYGTALGVIRSAFSAGRLAGVYADETRPRLQGAKLTAWECVQEGIPVTVITDSMAAHCMQKNLIHAVIVGADRITANGDTANKIGTYSLAVVSKMHNVPFFVAAPLSTVDFSLDTGADIPIEERDSAEIYQVGDTRICAEGANFYNPAFDVTPASLITAIITEKGAVKPLELKNLK
ncbi:MAG: Methylthioribose-1-phosphate isomerase [Chroococcopsis gigantea SAG 12.99]|jgi:methylthioribose-1-phosphate isomerase|nr:S-methyl-5-thioribose-1-phosphate isomerase [Chlorogloea purpurea SAG 13.99]MDV2999093.1 Methylthioribose-1-phosphate isomerase [Chroococcopsis gigantea SAG 12.99]